MNRRSVLLCFGLMSLVRAAFCSTTEAVEIRITGISSCQGSIMLAIYENERDFMHIEHAVIKEKIDLATANCVATLLYRAAIPHGQYAVVVYHDVNSNGIQDKDIFGVPAEAWGVSNNARPLFREPNFRECAFTYAPSNAKVTINIR